MPSLHLPCFKAAQPSYQPCPASSTSEPLPSPIAKVVLDAWDAYDWNHSSDAIADWLNGRWAKSGFEVSKETICFTLRSQGRDARMGLVDRLDGAFYRKIEEPRRR